MFFLLIKKDQICLHSDLLFVGWFVAALAAITTLLTDIVIFILVFGCFLLSAITSSFVISVNSKLYSCC